MGARELAFGPFVLDRSRMTLLREGKVLAIGQRGFALLWALAEADETVSRDQLMEAVWPGTVIEEGNLTVQIAGLRKALGQRPDGQEWIITVARVGYRLVRDSSALSTTRGLAVPLLAIRPFQNLSGGEGETQIANGVVEDLINALGRFRDFELQSRSMVGGDTGIRYLLEGSVRHVGGQFRITTQLVDGRTGAHVWTDSLDSADGDVLAVQDEVTGRVAASAIAALQLAEIELAAQETIPSAYVFYLQAVSKYKLLSPAGHAEGYRLLGQALELDPHYARALSHGAMLLSNNLRMGWPPLSSDDRATCAAFIERAEVGVSDDARVLSECSDAMLLCTREYRRAVELARRACAINPLSIQAIRILGIVSIHCGDLDEASEALRRAARLSPRGLLVPVSFTGVAHVAMIRGDYEEALGWAEKSLAVSARFDATYWMLIAANAHLGRLDAARSHLAELLKRVPDTTVAGIKAAQPDYDPTRLAAILDGLRIAGMP
jgi:DNA-binding winged helix-turn-helix (wHTH) protein